MLGHDHMNRRQLLDLMARRITVANQLILTEDVPAAALARPVLDDLVHRPRRQQRPALASYPGCAPCARPDESLPRRGGKPGGSELGGCDEFRDERLDLRSNCAIRSSWRATRAVSRSTCAVSRSFCADSSSNTLTTASPPCS